MKIDEGYYIIENVTDFQGYEIIHWEKYKEGVYRLWMKKDLKEYQKFYIVFCKNQHMPINIESHNAYWKN